MGSFINSREMITATKLRALIRKQMPAPRLPNTIPDNAGPTKRAMFTMEELRANAFGISSLLLTSSCTNGCLAGKSKALMMPNITLSVRICHTTKWLVRVSIANNMACIIEAT